MWPHLKWSHSWLNELIRSGSITSGILISTLFGLVLAAASPSPAVHGSNLGQTSFSGYLPPHVDPQHHSSPDIHTHHHSTPSTIFTSAGSWGSDLHLQDEPLLELSVGEVMKPDSQSLYGRFIFKNCLGSVLLKRYSIPNNNFSSVDSICNGKMTKISRRENWVKARKCLVKRFEEIYRFCGAGRFLNSTFSPHSCNEGF